MHVGVVNTMAVLNIPSRWFFRRTFAPGSTEHVGRSSASHLCQPLTGFREIVAPGELSLPLDEVWGCRCSEVRQREPSAPSAKQPAPLVAVVSHLAQTVTVGCAFHDPQFHQSSLCSISPENALWALESVRMRVFRLLPLRVASPQLVSLAHSH